MHTITKKSLTIPLWAAAFALLFSACSDDSTGPGEVESQIETYTATDVVGDTTNSGIITYYNLSENTTVDASDSASTNWDIAFSGTTIYTNSGVSGPSDGGAVILDQSFEATTIAPSKGYNIDTDTLLAIPTGSGNGWYNYTGRNDGNPPQHAVLSIENTTIVVRTADGEHYAKLRMISYYKGNPDISSETFENLATRPTGPMYTFEYAIQLNGSRQLQ